MQIKGLTAIRELKKGGCKVITQLSDTAEKNETFVFLSTWWEKKTANLATYK